MDNTNFADYGLVGIILFMTFQYLVKPFVANLLQRRASSEGNGHGSRMDRAEKDIEKLDKEKVTVPTCKVIHAALDARYASLDAKVETVRENQIEGQRIIFSKLDDLYKAVERSKS